MFFFIRPLILIVTMGRLFDPYTSSDWIPPECKTVQLVSELRQPRVFPKFKLRPDVEIKFLTTNQKICTKPECMILTFPDETPYFIERGDGQVVILDNFGKL
jgi:hypothetical protein